MRRAPHCSFCLTPRAVAESYGQPGLCDSRFGGGIAICRHCLRRLIREAFGEEPDPRPAPVIPLRPQSRGRAIHIVDQPPRADDWPFLMPGDDPGDSMTGEGPGVRVGISRPPALTEGAE